MTGDSRGSAACRPERQVRADFDDLGLTVYGEQQNWY